MRFQPTSVACLEQAPTVYVDAAVVDPAGAALFLSLWGRDTGIQELLAKVELGESEGGLSGLALDRHQVAGLQYRGEAFGSVYLHKDRLERVLGRTPKTGLFGELVHCWLFDRRLRLPDMANRTALVLRSADESPEACEAALWPLVDRISPVPLLPEWRTPILKAMKRHPRWLCELRCLGPLQAWQLDLGDPAFSTWVSEQVAAGELPY